MSAADICWHFSETHGHATHSDPAVPSHNLRRFGGSIPGQQTWLYHMSSCGGMKMKCLTVLVGHIMVSFFGWSMMMIKTMRVTLNFKQSTKIRRWYSLDPGTHLDMLSDIYRRWISRAWGFWYSDVTKINFLVWDVWHIVAWDRIPNSNLSCVS